MNDNNEALTKLVKGIIKAVEKKINIAQFNRGVTGRVISSQGDNKYIVSINNKTYTAKSRFELQENQIVKLIKWNNSYDELYIIY